MSSYYHGSLGRCQVITAVPTIAITVDTARFGSTLQLMLGVLCRVVTLIIVRPLGTYTKDIIHGVVVML